MSSTETILFIGASRSCGLSALRHSLAEGHNATAICRTPSKLSDILTDRERQNIRIEEGNAHDANVLSRLLVKPTDSTEFVEYVVTSIGAGFSLQNMGMDDKSVCEKGTQILLASIKQLRENGVRGHPHIVAVSSTGLSPFERDIPLPLVPLYRTLIKTAHKDKRAVEELLYSSNERWTIIRPSLLIDNCTNPTNTIRVGIEDPKIGIEEKAIGYVITREEVGRWIFKAILKGDSLERYTRKAVSLTR
jgi:putative NADH-flavin reductase